jgi:hypothetical protein
MRVACKMTNTPCNIIAFVRAVIKASENENLCEQCDSDRDIDLCKLPSQGSQIHR